MPDKKQKRVPKLRKPSIMGKILSSLSKPLKKVAKPFRFILAPLKLRPVRFIGRILRKILLIDYFIASWKEVRQVTWPGHKETIQLTIAVFIFAIGFGLFIAIVDFGLTKLFQEVLL